MVICVRMIPPMWSSIFLLISLLLPFSSTATSTPSPPRTCFICYNCLNYEAASQAKQCDEPEEQFCWKEELETGEVNRLCATQDKCDSATSNPHTSCCPEDKCNSSSQSSSWPLLGWGVVFFLLQTGGTFFLGA
eukprot:TRINITY_DN10847_c0_g1_i2.p1 TRINITY_DN10847_c0_g1~~TRINITY_DN10847_c0_g1_i2.p1  ORF type:complete len:134 (-),score=41.47 TRINITY_DN10847_c0_g1_i2:65-466(-)